MLPLVKEANEEHNIIIFGAVNTFRYTNWKGETSLRKVLPCCIRYGHSEYHPEDQWLLEAIDLDKMDYRTFALDGILAR
jgi:predicted DNA-binding transcriptional regulator YafY